jgi:hypothetical protein
MKNKRLPSIKSVSRSMNHRTMTHINEAKQNKMIVGDEIAGEIYEVSLDYDDSANATEIMDTYNDTIGVTGEIYEIYTDEVIDGVRVIGYMTDVLFWYFLTDNINKVKDIITKNEKFDNIIDFIDEQKINEGLRTIDRNFMIDKSILKDIENTYKKIELTDLIKKYGDDTDIQRWGFKNSYAKISEKDLQSIVLGGNFGEEYNRVKENGVFVVGNTVWIYSKDEDVYYIFSVSLYGGITPLRIDTLKMLFGEQNGTDMVNEHIEYLITMAFSDAKEMEDVIRNKYYSGSIENAILEQWLTDPYGNGVEVSSQFQYDDYKKWVKSYLLRELPRLKNHLEEISKLGAGKAADYLVNLLGVNKPKLTGQWKKTILPWINSLLN